MDILQTDIKYLKGVGPMRAKWLGEDLQIFTLRDLLYHFPYKYIDRSVIHRVADLVDGMPYVQLKGQIVAKNVEGVGRKERLTALFSDGTGVIELVWFRGIKITDKRLQFNHPYLLLGKPANFNGRINIAHPEMEDVGSSDELRGTMQPHYHTTDRMKRQGLTSNVMARLVEHAFSLLGEASIAETLPDFLLSRHHLMPLSEALHEIHRPSGAETLPEATRRLKFEELFYLQLDILRTTHHRRLAGKGFVFPKVGNLFLDFYHHHLPFQLTNAQKRVVREIRRDLSLGKQMNRLLQGDVGSGKTMVALLCCLLAIDNHFQACVMAPTEILAQQHFLSMQSYLQGLPVKIALLTGSTKLKERTEILRGVADGSVHLLVGTHALIEPTVNFLNLGLAVIDEQHRFGVKQRARLWQKNITPPHVLVMTATPIPRTLAMTVYGDLDVSIIDELPPGRMPVQTVHYRQADRPMLNQGLLQQLKQGRQVYVVYPLIKENEKQQLRDLETGYAQLVEAFPDFKVGMVHGRMKPAEKEAAMQAFKAGETQILVSTTVIEVGVNVPNASVMVIENADRFGLAQLHQLRGRVGRGSAQSFCILMTGNQLSENTHRRMKVMTDTADGFVIAEEDLKLRGPGDLEGTAQSGIPFNLHIAHITKDRELMEVAREDALFLLQTDAQENLPQNQMVWSHLRLLKKQTVNFSAIS